MKKELVTYFDPKSPVAEMFRTLRTNLQYMNAVEELNTLAITSTLPGEGKSWTSSNLAVAYAQAGKKVILIDADLRNGKQFTIFGIPPAPGLSNYLSGIIDKRKNLNLNNIEEFMYETDVQNLLVMPAGNVPPNPAELLVSAKMRDLLEKLKAKFDVIIFDTPPTLLVTDACALSRIVDTTMIVAAYGKTKKDDLQRVKKAIENVGGKVAGVVMNQVPMSESKYEGAYYYGSTVDRKASKKKSKESASFKYSENSRIKDEYRSTENIKTRETYRPIEKENVSYTSEDNIPRKKESIFEENISKYSREPERTNKTEIKTENKVENNNIKDKVENKTQIEKMATEEIKKEVYQAPKKTQSSTKKKVDTVTNKKADQTITIDRTQDILKQVNEYLDIEKKKLNNGGY